MNNKLNVELIGKLSNAFGVSGYEDEVRSIILSEITGACDSVVVDKTGNIIAEKNGTDETKPKIMLVANMDEPGFIISDVKYGGGAFLDFSPVGKIRPHTVLSESVVAGENKTLGIISFKAVHLTTKEEREKPVKLKDMFIDIGAEKQEDIDGVINIGDYAGFKPNFSVLGNCLCGKGLSSRVSCYAMIELLKKSLSNGLICVFTVQKQVGMRGSKIDFRSILKEDTKYTIVLDGIEQDGVKLGKGVIAPLMINETMADKEIFKVVSEALLNNGTTIAKKLVDSDIKSLSSSYFGRLSAEIDVPVMNINTPKEVVSISDIEKLIEVLEKILNS